MTGSVGGDLGWGELESLLVVGAMIGLRSKWGMGEGLGPVLVIRIGAHKGPFHSLVRGGGDGERL